MLVRIGCEGIHIIGAPANPYAGALRELRPFSKIDQDTLPSRQQRLSAVMVALETHDLQHGLERIFVRLRINMNSLRTNSTDYCSADIIVRLSRTDMQAT
jgi:hypothetical protein